MKKDKITAEAWVHWKQGDDFGGWLDEFSPPKALEMWGKSLKQKGDMLIRASEILANQNIKAQADTHHISLSNIDREVAGRLFKEVGLFYQDQFEKEHETCEGCEECCETFFSPAESFLDIVGCLKPEIERFYAIRIEDGKKQLIMHYPSVYNAWIKSYESSKTCKLPARKEILSAIRKEPFFVNNNILKRIDGRPVRSLILSLDSEDDPSNALLSFRLEKPEEEKNESKS